MTVCLNGDVNHPSLKTRDQAYLDGIEVEAPIRNAEITGERCAPVTLVVTGEATREESEPVRHLAAMDQIEIRRHYWPFGTPLHRLLRGVSDSWHGPRLYQGWKIRRILAAFEELGVRTRPWCNHFYRQDEHRIDLLARAEITQSSDKVDSQGDVRMKAALTVVYVNTRKYPEHIYHAFMPTDFPRDAGFEESCGAMSWEMFEWVEWDWEHLACLDQGESVATVLANSVCMWLAGQMEAFERLCVNLVADVMIVQVGDCTDGE